MNRLYTLAGCCALAFTLTGCAEDRPAAKKEAEKPLEPVTGRVALYKMYPNARGWASDVQPLQMKSIQFAQIKAEPGKAGAWQCTFVSPSQGKMRTYTYSVIEAEGNLHKGVFSGLDESWSAARGKPFLLAALKTDSDEVYKTSLKHGAAYSKKNPDKPINFLLEQNPRFGNPVWRVIWGDSVSNSNFSIFMDASTGDYQQTMR